MKALLTILLFVTLTANAQDPFVMGATYRESYVVWYPEQPVYEKRIYWKVRPGRTFRATKTPDRDPINWMPHTPTPPEQPKPIPAPTVVAYARQSAFDSLLAQVVTQQVTVAAIIKANDSLRQRLAPLEKNSGSITFRASTSGNPIMRKVNDSTYVFRSIVYGTKGKITDSTIVIPNVGPVTTIKAATVKKTAVKK